MPSFTIIPPRGNHSVHGHFWIPIDDENCWAWSFDYHPTRELTDAELAEMRAGKGIHAVQMLARVQIVAGPLEIDVEYASFDRNIDVAPPDIVRALRMIDDALVFRGIHRLVRLDVRVALAVAIRVHDERGPALRLRFVVGCVEHLRV